MLDVRLMTADKNANTSRFNELRENFAAALDEARNDLVASRSPKALLELRDHGLISSTEIFDSV